MFLTVIIIGCSSNTNNTNDDGNKSKNKNQIEPIAAIHNPERGFHLEVSYFLHDLENPFKSYTYPNGWIDDMNRDFESVDDSLSSLQLYIYLTEYVGKKIPEEAFEKLKTLFDGAQDKGYKFILRFAYDDTYNATNASYEDVFRHLNQLEPFIKNHLGMIDVWQRGFIGAWGEGHSSPMSSDWEGRSKMVKRMLDIFSGRQITERYPNQKNRLILPSSYMKRIGYNNDYFTASEHPKAPGNDFALNTDTYNQVLKESPHVKVLGEIPYAEETEWGLHELISVEKTLQILRDHHYSLFDITQNNELNIAHWKTYPIAPSTLDELNVLYDESYFKDESGNSVQRSAYDFIRDHLGYRLLFDFTATQLKADKNKLEYDIQFHNVGFSAILNPRPVYLVFINSTREEVSHKIKLDVNPKEWQPYDPDKKDYKILTHQIKGTTEVPLKGKYKVGLWLPDPTELLQYDAKYAMRFANREFEIWQDADNHYRINIIDDVKFE